MEFKGHETVMKSELVQSLLDNESEENDLVYFDLTLGGGGHSLELLNRSPAAKLVAVDQDQDALDNAAEFFKSNGVDSRVHLVKSNFSDFSYILESSKSFIGESKIAGFMAILECHLISLMRKKRAFSFRFDGH